MVKLIPSKNQWQKWSLISKISYIGFWIGTISLIIVIMQIIFNKSSNRELKLITKKDCMSRNDKNCPLTISTFVFDLPHSENDTFGNIKWSKKDVDVRILFENKSNQTIKDISLIIQPETHIRAIKQLSKIPNLVFEPNINSSGGIVLKTQNGKDIFVPFDPYNTITPSYKMTCTNLLSGNTINIIIACVVMNPWTDGNPPQHAIAARSLPKWIKIKGSYKTINIEKQINYKVNLKIDFKYRYNLSD